MSSSYELLKNAIILDTEASGLARGSGIHEIAIYNLETRHVYEYIVKPQLARSRHVNPLQDSARLSSTKSEVFELVPNINSWPELIVAQTNIEHNQNFKTLDEARPFLKGAEKFLYEALENNLYPHLTGKKDNIAAREAFLKTFGVAGLTSKQIALAEALSPSGELTQQLKGKTIWIANALYESKIFGAQIEAMSNHEYRALQFSMETHNYKSTDPFYVTGKEVNAAKVSAQKTGDWTKVWKAYNKYTPKPGETAVRDIQDVTRAFMSYGGKLGLFDTRDNYYGNAIDLTYRLFGSVNNDRSKLLFKEAHRAAEDAALSERYVLENAIKYTTALEHVHENTELGKHYVSEAKLGRGLLYEASQYFARLEEIAPEVQRANLVKRLARAKEDIDTQGYTVQITGTGSTYKMKQNTPLGESIEIDRLNYQKTKFHTLDKLAEFLDAGNSYSESAITAKELLPSLMAAGKGRAATEGWADDHISELLHGRKVSRIEAKIEKEADKFLTSTNSKLSDVLFYKRTQFVREAFDHVQETLQKNFRTVGKGAAAGALAITTVGFAFDVFRGNQSPQIEESVAAVNYEQWKQFYGMEMQRNENGVNAQMRKQFTDFGSPYRGMVASDNVFVDQELVEEREKWIRQQYGAKHDEAFSDVYGAYARFRSSSGYSFLTAGKQEKFNGELGLRGNLTRLDLSSGNWKIEAEDADTVVIRKGGIRGAISSFFGMNRGYSFRLAGIDSTETSHGSTSYHAPQPYAEDAAAAVRNMIAGSKKLEIIYDPNNTTYGRMMGAVIGDGKNLNFEIVRQGFAAHLPYGKAYESMIDYARLKELETQAYKSNKGMWNEPWAKSFYDFSAASGNRVTFNTFTKKSKLVENETLMKQLSMMESAQAYGYTQEDVTSAQEKGRRYSIGSDFVTPGSYELKSSPALNYYDQMLSDTANFVKTKGSSNYYDKLSSRGGYGKLNTILTLDTMESTNSIWNQRNPQAFQVYNVERQRKRELKAKMSQEQRRINQEFGKSHVQHHRM